MEVLGLDPTNMSTNLSTPIGIGNVVAAELIAGDLRVDGWNANVRFLDGPLLVVPCQRTTAEQCMPAGPATFRATRLPT